MMSATPRGIDGFLQLRAVKLGGSYSGDRTSGIGREVQSPRAPTRFGNVVRP
jgi:hypothetical protein